MIIEPLGKSRFKSVVLLVPKWRSLTAYTPFGVKTASGVKACLKLLEDLEMNNLYVSHSLRELLNATGANNWEASLWKGHVTTLRLDGTKVRVHSLRRLLDEIESDEDKYKALTELTQVRSSRSSPRFYFGHGLELMAIYFNRTGRNGIYLKGRSISSLRRPPRSRNFRRLIRHGGRRHEFGLSL